MLLVSSVRAQLAVSEPLPFDAGNPFIADSAHHRPIGSGAVFADANHESTIRWAQTPGTWGDFNGGSPFGRVVHVVDASSPRVTINVNPAGENAVLSIPATNIPFPPSITFNSNTPNNDSVVVIIESDTGMVHEFRECRAQSGFVATPSAPMLARSYRPHWAIPQGAANTPLTYGLGHGISMGQRVGHSASSVSALFGLFRPEDINENRPIGHVLQTVLPSHNTTSYPSPYPHILSKDIILPATSRDAAASQPGRNLGAVPYGGLLSLPHGFNIYTRGYNATQLKLAEAIWGYGIMAVDEGGNFAIRAAQGFTNTQLTQLRTCLRDLKPFLRLILNSDWDPNDRRKAAGGGTPRASNTAYNT